MRGKVQLLLLVLIAVSCGKEDPYSMKGIDYDYGRGFSHEKIVLGKRLENPYRTENITRALQELYPTKASRVEVEPTDYYVRFLRSIMDLSKHMQHRLLDETDNNEEV